MPEDNITKKKIAIVTGANKGIGFEISRQLGFAGYKVYMGGRMMNRIQQSSGLLRGEGHEVVPFIMDVNDKESIDSLIKMLNGAGEKVDTLINNAAILLDDHKGILDLKKEEIDLTMATNAVAPLVITKALLSIMNPGCRVVMLSANSGSYCREKLGSWAPIYSLSKTVLNGITRQLAPVLLKRNIYVNVVDPGWVRTSMGGNEAPRTIDQGAETPVWLATDMEFTETGKFWRDKEEIPW